MVASDVPLPVLLGRDVPLVPPVHHAPLDSALEVPCVEGWSVVEKDEQETLEGLAARIAAVRVQVREMIEALSPADQEETG